MTSSCIRLLCLLVLCCIALSSSAQETTSYSRPQVSIPDPIFLLNSTIIVNGVIAEFTTEDTKSIKKIEVHKNSSTPDAQPLAPQVRNLRKLGVIDITSPKRIRSQSLTKLGRQLGLHGPLIFAINGHSLDAQSAACFRIASSAIGQLHISRPTPEVSETRVDIWLVPPPKLDRSKYPPGTIFVR